MVDQRKSRDIGSPVVAADLGAELVDPILIEAALGQPAMSVPRYRAVVRMAARKRVATFNKGAAARIDDGDGFPTFAELLVAMRLRSAGWNCTWASAYTKQFIEMWAWNAKEPIASEKPSPRVLDLLQAVAAKRDGITGRRRSFFQGMPDVVAWRDSDLLMIECKRFGKDRIQKTQAEWFQAASLCGVGISQLGVFEWQYADGGMPVRYR